MRAEEVKGSDVVQIMMTGVSFKRIVAYLRSRGLDVEEWQGDPDDLPTFMITISDDLMKRANR